VRPTLEQVSKDGSPTALLGVLSKLPRREVGRYRNGRSVPDLPYKTTIDADGVALAAIKELAKQNQELRDCIVQLEALTDLLHLVLSGY
jgi:hypothetical protein